LTAARRGHGARAGDDRRVALPGGLRRGGEGGASLSGCDDPSRRLERLTPERLSEAPEQAVVATLRALLEISERALLAQRQPRTARRDLVHAVRQEPLPQPARRAPDPRARPWVRARSRDRTVRGAPTAAARSLRAGDSRRPAFLTEGSRSVRDSAAHGESLNNREHDAINKRGRSRSPSKASPRSPDAPPHCFSGARLGRSQRHWLPRHRRSRRPYATSG